MNAREVQADELHTMVAELWGEYSSAKVADAILAAGYRKPRTITTAEELDALPDGAGVLDADRDVSTKHNGMWHGYEMNPLDSRKFAKCGPFTVLHEGVAA